MMKLPYDTTVCGMYQIDKLINLVKRANIEYPLPQVETPSGNTLVDCFYISPNDVYSDIPAFTQFLNIGTTDSPKLVFDARQYMRWDMRDGVPKITARNDYTFQCIRLALTLSAMNEMDSTRTRMGDIPAKTFIRWINGAIAQRFNIPLETQLSFSVVIAYYYVGMIDPEAIGVYDDLRRYGQMVHRWTNAPMELIYEILDKLQPMRNADNLAEQLTEATGSIRVPKLRFADLFIILANSFVGVNARENIGVALEHHPTFIAMVYSVLIDRSYRKTVIARRAESAGRQAELKQFTDTVIRQVATKFQ